MLQRFRLSLSSRTKHFLLFTVALSTLFARSVPVSAAIIVNDTWQDGTDSDPAPTVYSEYGVDSDGDTNLESAWFQGGDGTLDPVGVGGPLRAKFSAPTSASSASWTTYFTPDATPVTLANTGDFVKVTWVFTPTNINNGGSNTSQNFRFALVDSPAGTRVATTNGAPGSGAFTGYAMFTNMSGTLGNSSPFRLEKRNVASGDVLATSGNWTAVGTTGATSGAHGYDSGTQYTLEWLITRNAASGLDESITMSGGTLNNSGTAQVLFTDSTPGALGGFTFDTFALRPSGATTTAEQFDTSLFKVETNTALVPEPTTVVLVSLSSLAIGLFGRRRQLR
jgi:hypothetical protein